MNTYINEMHGKVNILLHNGDYIMTKSIFIMGLRLFLISVIYRIIAFMFFSYSWQWENLFTRAIEIAIGILYISIWFIYGLKKKLGFIKGLFVGFIGAGDAVILMVISLILYLNRGSYYFGPIEMSVWNVPMLGVLDMINLNSDILVYFLPFVAILLTAVGSIVNLEKKNNTSGVKI